MSEAIPSWIEQEAKKIKEQQEKESIFFKLPEGETQLLINDAEPPKVIQKTFKNDTRTRYQFDVVIMATNEQKTLECGKQLYRQIIQGLMQKLNPMTIIRAGTDITTKYTVKGLMK